MKRFMMIVIGAVMVSAASAFALQVPCSDCSYTTCMPDYLFEGDPAGWQNCMDICYMDCWSDCTLPGVGDGI